MPTLRRIALAASLALLAPAAIAQTFDVSETTVQTNTPNHGTTVTFTQGATATTSFDFALTYNPLHMSFVSANSLATGIACADPVPLGVVLCFADAGGAQIPLNAISPNPAIINILFNILAVEVPDPGSPLTLAPGSITDVNGGSQTASGSSDLVGSVIITGGPPPPVPEVDPVPAPGARTITDQVGGGATSDVITISNVGEANSSLTLSVLESGDTTNVFTGTLAAPTVAAGASTTLTVACATTVAGSFTATYVVTTNDTSEPTLTYTYTCTGNVGPAPEVNAVPAPGARIINDPVGGGATNDVIAISNIGNADLTLSVAETLDPSNVFTGTLGSTSIAGGASTTLTVGCTAPSAGPFTATYTVTTNDSDEPTLVYTYTCTGVTAPEFSSNPPAGSAINLLGAPGATLGGSVVISNTGTAPLTIRECTATGGFTVTAPTFPATIQPNASTSLNFTCLAPTVPGGSNAGTLSCVGINDSDETSATYALTCSSKVLAVPTMSLAGKTLLATLLAGLGLLGFALRRKRA